MKSRSDTGIRLTATTIIWGFATGMLALCIPLVGMTGTPVLPISVVIGATVGTVVVWRSGEHQSRNNLFFTNSVKELEQRVANLEIICSIQELDLHNKIKQLESKDK